MTQDNLAALPLLQGLLDHVMRAAELQRTQNEILEFMQGALVSTEGLGSVPLSGDEAARIADSKAIVNEVVHDLHALLERIHDPVLRNDLLETINSGLLHAYILGNYSTPSEAVWQLHVSEHKRKRAAEMRDKRAAKNKERPDKLKAAILSVSKPEELGASSKFAGSIRGSVLRYLGVASANEWPSARTIERAISAILKEREKR
jgi:hypothetical protein